MLKKKAESEVIEEAIKFPDGFQVFTAGVKQQAEKRILQPICTLSPSGFLSFNKAAASYLLKGREGHDNCGVFLAFNRTKSTLAIKPVPYHLGPPKTFKLNAAGANRNAALVSFITQGKSWQIALDGSRHPCIWDDRYGLLIVPLSQMI